MPQPCSDDPRDPAFDDDTDDLYFEAASEHALTHAVMACFAAVEVGRAHTVTGAAVDPDGTVTLTCRCGQQLAADGHPAHYGDKVFAATAALAECNGPYAAATPAPQQRT